jgi:L-lactate dehydrogenase complex protein LldG
MSKHDILSRIRTSLNRNGPLPNGVSAGLRARLATPALHLRPAFSEQAVERFVEKLQGVAGSVDHCKAGLGIAEAVQRYLDERDLAQEIVVSTDELIGDVPWSNQMRVKHGRPDPHDKTSVTGAFAAIAETGTVVLLSSPESPTTLNLLPENHIVAVRREHIVRHQEDVWRALRQRPDGMPRTVNLITGPSRTGDVEQVLQLGAHGPRQLHVLVVNDDA